MAHGTVGLLTSLALVLLVGVLVSFSGIPTAVKRFVYIALALRIAGAAARYWVLMEYYGIGDAMGYYEAGIRYAERMWRGDFSMFYDSAEWWIGTWWGTQFVRFPSGLVLAVIGPTMLGEFIIFSLLGFLGLVGFAVAYRKSYPDAPLTRYLRWIWFFPSLIYWPSGLGKEAIVILGIGLTVWGFVGGRERIRWWLLAIGLFLIFAIRPQVAAVMMFSLMAAHWLSFGGNWTLQRSLQGALILVLGLIGTWYSMQYVGIAGYDVEGTLEYLESNPGRRVGGGSEIEAVEVGWTGIPLAVVNVLFRPFPWEADNLMVLVTSLEIVAFWAIVWVRRASLLNTLSRWRSDGYLRLAIPFLILYAITLGMAITNLGIIARQRVFLFPFLFLLLEARPKQPGAVVSSRTRKLRRPEAALSAPVR